MISPSEFKNEELHEMVTDWQSMTNGVLCDGLLSDLANYYCKLFYDHHNVQLNRIDVAKQIVFEIGMYSATKLFSKSSWGIMTIDYSGLAAIIFAVLSIPYILWDFYEDKYSVEKNWKSWL